MKVKNYLVSQIGTLITEVSEETQTHVTILNPCALRNIKEGNMTKPVLVPQYLKHNKEVLLNKAHIITETDETQDEDLYKVYQKVVESVRLKSAGIVVPDGNLVNFNNTMKK